MGAGASDDDSRSRKAIGASMAKTLCPKDQSSQVHTGAHMSVRWTDADLRKLRTAMADDKAPPQKRSKPYRSQWEAEYAGVLELRYRAGEIVSYGYERITLVLPGIVRYTPDFDCVLPDGTIEMHEVKGVLKEVARDRLRSAVETYPHIHWYLIGESRTPVRLYTPADVPSARKVVK